jgi:undecaprenyl diphosphate synthase
MIAKKKVPQHVAIIMDGNSRWARSRALPRLAGHRAGVDNARKIIKAASELGIKFLTLYTFSTENWRRPKNEVEAIFGLLEKCIEEELYKLHENGIRFTVTGDIEGIPEPLKSKLKDTIRATAANDRMTVSLALNYGSRSEIVRASRLIASDVLNGRIKVEDISEDTFPRYLYTKDSPDPELLIRTSGELRLSNFLLWQISYSEIYITKKMWPDFGPKDLKEALAEFSRRQRRFGG